MQHHETNPEGNRRGPLFYAAPSIRLPPSLLHLGGFIYLHIMHTPFVKDICTQKNIFTFLFRSSFLPLKKKNVVKSLFYDGLLGIQFSFLPPTFLKVTVNQERRCASNGKWQKDKAARRAYVQELL